LELASEMERGKLHDILGPLFCFDPRNRNGRYVLDLRSKYQNVLARTLLSLSVSEGMELEASGRPDISQSNNKQCWRNESLNLSPFTLQHSWILPNDGLLRLDYLSFERPPADAQVWEAAGFEAWLEAFQVRLEAPTDWVSPDGSWLTWLQRHCMEGWLSAEQVGTILDRLPDEMQKVEGFVACWSRLVDEENTYKALEGLSPLSRRELSERIGFLSLFNPLQPNGHYILDLAKSEQHTLAHVLVVYAAEEPGENIRECTYTFGGDEPRQCQIPQTWVDELPVKGTLSFMYYVAPGQENMEMRKATATRLLGWEF